MTQSRRWAFAALASVALAVLGGNVIPVERSLETPGNARPTANAKIVASEGRALFDVGAAGSVGQGDPAGGPPGVRLECPPDALLSQPPHMPDDPAYWSYTSDAATEYLVYDQYQGSGEICGVRFWGFDVIWDGAQFLDCIEDPMTFEVKFYQDAEGLPGAAVCSYTITPARVPTGLYYYVSERELNEYSADLDPCCTLQSGWVSIQGVSVGGDPDDCWFHWLSSPVGDGVSLQARGADLVWVLFDRAMCLSGAYGACCFADKTCQELTAADCTTAGGTFQGDGTSCDPNPCIPPGDTCDAPLQVTGLPFNDGGDTCAYTDDYDETCPDYSPGSGDLVYSYAPVADICVTITLCTGLTDYDSKLFVYENACPDVGSPFACNDDACTSAAGHDNVSRLCLSLSGGNTYYIVVDGQAGDCGYYEIDIAEDTTPPMLTPGTIDDCYATQASAEEAAVAATEMSDNCTATEDLLVWASTDGDCSATVTVTVTDQCGNSDSVDYGTRIDGELPVISGCPDDIQVENDVGQCHALVTWTEPMADDNCGLDSFASTHSPGDTFPVGTTTVTYTAIDQCGNESTCSFDVTVTDTEQPVISDCPSDMTVDNDPGKCSAVVTWTEPLASDNCAVASFVSTHNPGDTFAVGTTTVTYTAEDAAGNTATCSFDVTVDDAEAPVITECADPVTLYVDVGDVVYVPDLTGDVTAADNCDADLTITQDPPAGSAIGFGAHTVLITVTDDAGLTDTCQTTVTVQAIGAARLEMEVAQACYMPGDTVTVRIWMLNIAETIRAGQFFLTYDGTKLELVSADPGAFPFIVEIYECSPLVATVPDCPQSIGFIGYAVGIPDGEAPISGDAVMAVLTFTAPQQMCSAPGLITWPEHEPPTRLSGSEGQAVNPLLVDLDVVDDSGPAIGGLSVTGGQVDSNCVATVSFEATVTDDCCLDPDSVLLDIVLTTDNADLGSATIDKTLLPDGKTVQIDGSVDVLNLTSCPATVQVTVFATDCCGNGAGESATSAMYGRWTESYPDYPPGDGSVVNAASWDGFTLGTEWILSGPTRAGAPELLWDTHSSDPDGNGEMVWRTQYTGGTLDVDPTLVGQPAGPMLTGNVVRHTHITHQVYVGGELDGDLTWTDMATHAVFPELSIAATATGVAHMEGSGTESSYPEYPDFAPGHAFGEWGRLESMTFTTVGNETADVIDAEVPDITCPEDVTVLADAGGCDALVDPGMAAATDNCDPAPAVAAARDDGLPLTDPYPVGITTITWRATDACGNYSECTHTITVDPVSELVVGLALSPTVVSPLTRCVTFELWECGGPSSVVVDQELTFVDGQVTAVLEVPCGDYSCITARDKLHTLRRTLDSPDFQISDAQYIADFVTAGKPLIGGDLNDDNYIDSLDYGVYTSQAYMDVGPSSCATSAPHADINGDGLVSVADFTFIQVNFSLGSEPNCCGQPAD